MTIDQILALIFAGGVGGVIVAIANALKMRRDAERDDRKQAVDATSTLANSASTIAESTSKIIEMKDGLADELRAQMNDLRTELQKERNKANQDREEFGRRITEAENRIARSERRAGEAERQAIEFITDVIKLGEELAQERTANSDKIASLKREHQNMINKLVVIIESLFRQMKAAGIDPDFDLGDLENLKAMYVIEKATA
ncbi:hypothetical protein TFLX_03125 [Thermoflexales bacterium]|nr:hypothetical protein TFLX_03125 [Thermoflexales bacterium]